MDLDEVWILVGEQGPHDQICLVKDAWYTKSKKTRSFKDEHVQAMAEGASRGVR